MRSILLCLGLLSGCAGLWGPFLGEPGPGGEGGTDGGVVADLSLPPEGTCTPTARVQGQSGDPTQLTANLYGVWGAHDDAIWAVGEAGLILHWDGGGAWHVENEIGKQYQAVWGPNDSFVAVATQERAVLRRSEVGYWGPQPAAGVLDVVHDIGGSGAELQLAGGVGYLGGAVVQYNSDTNAWARETTLSPGSGFEVYALSVQGAVPGSFRLVLAGALGNGVGGFVRLYEGASKAWTRSFAHDDLAHPVSTAVLTGGELFTADTAGLLTRYGTSGGATAITRPSAETISKLRPAVTPGRFWAVGEQGLLAYWDGTTLGPREAGTTRTLLDAWQSPTGVLWVVGAGGTILRCAPKGPS